MDFGLTNTPQQKDLTFLSKYTKNTDLPSLDDEVRKFVEDIKASKLHVYRCIQSLSFLTPKIQNTLVYEEMLKRIDSVEIADLGCAFGQETRKLLLDGVKPKKITAIDLHDGYWNLSKKLFKDGDSIDSVLVNTVFGDLAKPVEHGGLDLENLDLLDKFDYAFALAVLHCLSQEQIEVFLSNVFKILKPNSGAKFFGWNVGTSTIAGNPIGAKTPQGNAERFWHTTESLRQLLNSKGFVNIQVVSKPVHNNPGDVYKLQMVDHDKTVKKTVENWGQVRLFFSCEKS
eukprot:TRINITY_DN25451_c0_g1_i2.p1 TRINITY_DN25451_c0_g1~~TRINITY_DN25451_c0_g1_i2.p1  ORF type:complete len:333 (-),score=101.08 TRINITY_DN25451_c0_g1_i2:62-919(-)